jgi:CPA1 family monovalent cation:H+ antiporter
VDLSRLALCYLLIALLATLSEPLIRRLRMPPVLAWLLAGILGAAAMTSAGLDTGLRWDTFEPLVSAVFIPVLVFHAALEIDPSRLRQLLGPILILAMPVMLVATLIIAIVMYVAIGHPEGFPWIAAALAGALLASTDPGPATALLRGLPGGERLALLLDGESLFNDALAIVLYGTLLPLALMSSMEGVSGWEVAYETLLALAGGLAVGAPVAAATRWLLQRAPAAHVQALLSLGCVYASHVIADILLGWSGVMAVLASGLLLGRWLRRPGAAEAEPFVLALWSFIAYLANGLLFLLGGMTFTLAMFTEQWLAMLIAIAATACARPLSLMAGFLIARWSGPGRLARDRRDQVTIALGGTRGVVTLALALALPPALDYWFTIQAAAYGVVVFGLVVQTPCLAGWLRRSASSSA